jgi:hypothetical protein
LLGVGTIPEMKTLRRLIGGIFPPSETEIANLQGAMEFSLPDPYFDWRMLRERNILVSHVERNMRLSHLGLSPQPMTGDQLATAQFSVSHAQREAG